MTLVDFPDRTQKSLITKLIFSKFKMSTLFKTLL